MATQIISKAAETTSAHIGAVGDRLAIDGVVRKVFGGANVLHIIHDKAGNEFTLRAKKCIVRSVGALVRIEATVTGHSVFRDVKRTELGGFRQMVVGDDHEFLAR